MNWTELTRPKRTWISRPSCFSSNGGWKVIGTVQLRGVDSVQLLTVHDLTRFYVVAISWATWKNICRYFDHVSEGWWCVVSYHIEWQITCPLHVFVWAPKNSILTTNWKPQWISYPNIKLSYRRGTARCVVSIEILPIAAQQCRNYLCDKSWPNRWYKVGDIVGGNAW